ncbi:uncharacterized protein ASPGLDRAFT_83891 [Aspergillus glaucus CBS 516.65]|uniref:Uncharacterized protein n=1 Tax=Aspergillus glaucus CBS 516.65 TaxID=1160497 RepID=A0A1L9VE89_ASPGL|nr:hypothetical protein ASPGLDRAFT_83891 [Aspergillus glaucus CBS 516.65]OJJ82214.1 hypothetical protein ASPGLDRAFT_83891 [Aspergillus glaucus CBS 516.65]
MSSIITAVLNAAKANSLPEVKAALDSWMAHPRDPRWPMVDFQEALTAALEERNVEVAEELIRRGCCINTDAVIAAGDSFNEETGWSSRSYDVLLQNGWDPNEDLGEVGNALNIAIGADSAPVVKYLLEHGANPNDNYYLDEYRLSGPGLKSPKTRRLFSYFLTTVRRSNI